MLKTAEIRGMAPDEMSQKVEALKKDLFTLRLELRMGKLEKHNRIRDIKKSIARLFTLIRESELEIKKTPNPGGKKEVKKEAEKKVVKKETKETVKKAQKVKKGKS